MRPPSGRTTDPGVIPDQLSGGPHFAAFTEHYIKQTKGRWAGRPLILEGWEREFWWEALELDPTTGLRVYREVGLGLPTKNGKSTQASAGAHYGLVADGEAEPEVYIGAASQKQAGIVLGQCRTMGLRSPALARLVTVQQHRILCPRNGGIMRALASDGGLQHGLNPSWNVLDEIHAHKNDGLFLALTKSGAAREQSLTNWITTAGPDEPGLLASLYGQMFAGTGELEKRDGLLIYRDKPNGTLIFWYGASREDDPDDPAVWRKVNPASWLQDGVWLRQQHDRMVARGDLLGWRIYHLNQFAGTTTSWLPPRAFGLSANMELELNPRMPVGVGVFETPDRSGAAIAIVQRQGEHFVARVEFADPDATTGRVSRLHLRTRLTAIRKEYPKPAAVDEETKRPIPGPAIAFERWHFEETADELDAAGLNMVDFGQLATTMGPASTKAYELITTKRLAHLGEPKLTQQVESSQAVLTDRGMRVVPSRNALVPNHGAIALIMGVAMASLPTPGVRGVMADWG